ncbi:MAG: glutathione S-transferase C-terminal domain-containing protein, partial [Oricola sp.]|nr:glutathione S-transferase C-terminal domain-containing protein [Oricola sp.]
VLELGDGHILTESIAICRYFETLCPEPPLFGTGAFGQAEVEMWQRRIELHFMVSVSQAFRHIHPAMKDWEVPQVADWGEANKPKAIEFAAFLNDELAGRSFIAGETISVADITAVVATDFCKPARIAIPDEFVHFRRWHAAMRERPSYPA